MHVFKFRRTRKAKYDCSITSLRPLENGLKAVERQFQMYQQILESLTNEINEYSKQKKNHTKRGYKKRE